MTTVSPKIVVLGSINMDLVVQCDRHPLRGQTVLADSSSEFCGGKGANQAVAASLVGGSVTMIGAIGDDGFSSRLLNNLRQHRIDRQHLFPRENQSSGLAVITVDGNGENSIIVVSGANATVTPADVAAKAEQIQKADVLLVQLEIPVDAVLKGIEIASTSDTRVILDPAPAPSLAPSALFDVDLLCPNELEAASLTGLSVYTVEDATKAAIELHRRLFSMESML